MLNMILMFIVNSGNSYRDIMYCNKKPFYLKGKGVDSSTMDAYLMHAVSFTLSLWSRQPRRTWYGVGFNIKGHFFPS
jgi:hypothetical protein